MNGWNSNEKRCWYNTFSLSLSERRLERREKMQRERERTFKRDICFLTVKPAEAVIGSFSIGRRVWYSRGLLPLSFLFCFKASFSLLFQGIFFSAFQCFPLLLVPFLSISLQATFCCSRLFFTSLHSLIRRLDNNNNNPPSSIDQLYQLTTSDHRWYNVKPKITSFTTIREQVVRFKRWLLKNHCNIFVPSTTTFGTIIDEKSELRHRLEAIRYE